MYFIGVLHGKVYFWHRNSCRTLKINIKVMMRCLWSLLVLCALFCVSPVSAQTLLSEEIKEDSVTGQDVVEKAKEFIGVPYRYGQMNPKRGFDCSGFTTYVFKSLNICLTRSSRSQFREGVKIDDRRDLQQGDLVFFTGTRSKKTIGHVGIVTDVDEETGEFEFIHAGRKGICINSSSDGYYDRRYVGARRVLG